MKDVYYSDDDLVENKTKGRVHEKDADEDEDEEEEEEDADVTAEDIIR